MEIPCFGWGFSRHAGLPAVVHRPCSENLSSWLPQLIESKRPRISRFQCSRNRCFLRYNVPARRAFCPCARLLRFNSETNLVQRQFAFLHFPKAWWEASGWSQLSQGVARCTFRFWLRVCFLSCSAIGASPFGSRVTSLTIEPKSPVDTTFGSYFAFGTVPTFIRRPNWTTPQFPVTDGVTTSAREAH